MEKYTVQILFLFWELLDLLSMPVFASIKIIRVQCNLFIAWTNTRAGKQINDFLRRDGSHNFKTSRKLVPPPKQPQYLKLSQDEDEELGGSVWLSGCICSYSVFSVFISRLTAD